MMPNRFNWLKKQLFKFIHFLAYVLQAKNINNKRRRLPNTSAAVSHASAYPGRRQSVKKRGCYFPLWLRKWRLRMLKGENVLIFYFQVAWVESQPEDTWRIVYFFPFYGGETETREVLGLAGGHRAIANGRVGLGLRTSDARACCNSLFPNTRVQVPAWNNRCSQRLSGGGRWTLRVTNEAGEKGSNKWLSQGLQANSKPED